MWDNLGIPTRNCHLHVDNLIIQAFGNVCSSRPMGAIYSGIKYSSNVLMHAECSRDEINAEGNTLAYTDRDFYV